jgi:ABC-2 type transport system permease protein
MGKEFRLFSRDMMQAFQLLLLLTLCFIYLYNFRMVGDTDALPLAMRGWWKAVLSLANIGTGSFVIGAISNRFVFPSVSLEGQNFWILQTSPMSTQEILRTKFLCWFIPLGLIATIVFLSGGLALQADPEVLIGSAVAGGIISYGIVGLAVGLGACFVKFDWEHVSQLGASVGSLVFMGACAILVMIDVLPCALLLFFRVMHDSSATLTAEQWFVSAASVTLLLLWINVSITRWALRIGAQQLEEKTNG